MKKDDLTLLKEKLPDQWAAILASKLNYTPDYIRKVLSGKRKNQEIIDEAIALAAEYKSRLENQKNIIASL
jgi:hypothetical protein